MSPTPTTEESALRERLHRLEDHLTSIVDETSDHDVRPAGPRPVPVRSRRLVAAAALVVLGGAIGAAALATNGDRPAEVSTADVPPLPAPDDDHTPLPTTVLDEEGPTVGGEPTDVVVAAGAALDLGVVTEWVTYPGGGWRASYAAAGDAPAAAKITTGQAPDPRADGRDLDLGQVLLPGSSETVIDGADAGFIRRDALATDISGVRDGRFVTVSLSPSLGLDQEAETVAFQQVLAVVLGN